MNNKLHVNIHLQPAYSYPIEIASGLLTEWSSWLPNYAPSRKVLIISDGNVAPLYGQLLLSQLQQAGYQVELLIFTAGETSKSATTKLELEEQMFAFGCDRHTLCLALGGGVVGDLAGFTAATYMRGINYVQLPTSLLAMIDSSVGGKTAVNTSYGKNIIGAFWQPRAVLMDIASLASLPAEQINNGLFEAIKIFLTCNSSMVAYCQKHLAAVLQLQPEPLTKVIYEAVTLKAHVVEVDEKEQNLRMILNYGHSVAHALEKLSNYTILHGFAVGVGMLAEAKVAQLLGLLSEADFRQIADLLTQLGAHASLLATYPVADIIKAMRGDKKNYNQTIAMVLLTGIGQVKNINNQVAFAVAENVIAAAIEELIKG